MARQARRLAVEAIERANSYPQEWWGCWCYAADTRVLILRAGDASSGKYFLLHRPYYARLACPIGRVVFSLLDHNSAPGGTALCSGQGHDDLWLVSLRTTYAEHQVLCKAVTFYEEASS